MFFRKSPKVKVKVLRTDHELCGRRIDLTTIRYESKPYYLRGIRGNIGDLIEVNPKELLEFGELP